jgi:hypothetical protein
LTQDEIAFWQSDSLEFFLYIKEESNQTRGNYLRTKALRLLAAIELRFADYFREFCLSTMS